MAKASRALRGRMRSVQNTRKITRTMELVSTSKLKRAQDRVVAARPYAEALRLRLLEGRERAACAESLGVTIGAFDVLMHRAARGFARRFRDS